MRNVLMIATGLLGLWWVGTTAGQPPGPPPIPESMASRFVPEGPPWWVSSRAAARPDGEIEWSLFRPAIQENLQEWLESDRYREQGCVGPYEVHVTLGNRPRIESFSELVVESRAIYQGTVTRVQGGFLFAQPGTLLQVSVQQVIKDSKEFEIKNHLYVFYPQGNFRVGKYEFCIRNSEYPEVPARGSRILVLPSIPPDDAGRKLIYPYLGEVIVETPDGGLGVPAIWRNEVHSRGLSTWNELMSTVESLLAQGTADIGIGPIVR